MDQKNNSASSQVGESPHPAPARKELAHDLAANCGLAVFPLWWPSQTAPSKTDQRCACGDPSCSNVGKHPIPDVAPHGFKDATRDPEIIERWWTEYPQANIGVATGASSGVDVLDVDPRHGGDHSLSDIESEHEHIPATVECLTGGGGRHLYFKHTPGLRCSNGGIAPGLDFKTTGGYVVGHGSLHATGLKYAWEWSADPDEVPIVPLPPWLLATVAKPERPVTKNGVASDGELREGERHKALRSIAGALRHRGCGQDEIEVALQAVNRARCVPPKPDRDIKKLAASYARYPPAELADSTPALPISRFRPFPDQALPASLRRFVVVSAERMGCDPVYLIQPALACLAGAVGASVAVVVRSRWIEPCVLWTGVVAPPSTMKSPARRAAMEPVYAAQHQADCDYDAETSRHRNDLLMYTSQIEEMKRIARKRGEPLAEQIPPEPAAPIRRQIVVRDATRESLVHVLADNHRGVVSDQDELAGMLGAFGAYAASGRNRGEPDAAFYKSAWSGETFIENRKAAGGSYVNIRPLVSIFGAIQPDALGPVLGRQRLVDGSASRFLWALPPDNPGRFPGEGDDETDQHVEEYAAVHRSLLSIPPRTLEDGRRVSQHVGLTKEAQAIGCDWVNENADRISAEADPALRAALGKLKGYLFRLALLFELIDWAARGEQEPLRAVGADAIRRASVVADWYTPSRCGDRAWCGPTLNLPGGQHAALSCHGIPRRRSRERR